jgi:glycerophosphoryl diester phosphodiesterase
VSGMPPRLKWHMLRRRKSDPAFLRENLAAALEHGAACEVDIVFTADGHAFCLHDLTLDRETTGTGLAAQHSRAEIERMRQRGHGDAVLDSPPLFLDEIAAMVRKNTRTAPAQVQLDIKAPIEALTREALERIEEAIGDVAPGFIAGGYDWSLIQSLAAAVPGLHAGFDPLAHYPRSCALDRNGFVEVGEKTLAIAPVAAMYYLEAKLVLGALDYGVNLIDMVGRNGAMIDVWTLDANRPDLHRDLRRVIEAGCDQITSNDPDALYPLIEEIARDCDPHRREA